MRGSTSEQRFRDVYGANFAAITGYAMRRAASAEDAADVVAETFLVAWRRLADVPAGDAARLWLYATARRILSNQRRSARRGTRLSERLAGELRTAVVRGQSDQVH